MDRTYDEYKNLVDEHLLDFYRMWITRASLFMNP